MIEGNQELKLMSIPPESPWRGASAFLSQPVNEKDVLAARSQVEMIYKNNARFPIEYRSSDGQLDTLHHVFRWDTRSYEFVFQKGFKVRCQEGTPDNIYYNLEDSVNNGGRPLDTRRATNHAFVSTTLRGSWVPPNSGEINCIYRYEIYAPGGIWVAETLGDRYRRPVQDEIAFPVGIAPQYIRSAQAFELVRERRWRRSNTTLFINTNFNPQACPQRILRLQRPICNYIDENKQRRRLVVQEYPERSQRRATAVNYDSIIDYYKEGVTKLGSNIESIFCSTKNNEYIFMKKEYVLTDYSPGSTNDRDMSQLLTENRGLRKEIVSLKERLQASESNQRSLVEESAVLKNKLKMGMCQEEGLRKDIVSLNERLQASESNQRSLARESAALKIKLEMVRCQKEGGGNVKLYAVLTVVGGIFIAIITYREKGFNKKAKSVDKGLISIFKRLHQQIMKCW